MCLEVFWSFSGIINPALLGFSTASTGLCCWMLLHFFGMVGCCCTFLVRLDAAAGVNRSYFGSLPVMLGLHFLSKMEVKQLVIKLGGTCFVLDELEF
ncbi:hypothetical protein Nepgr_031328 [Nepenthes gracilis]|uniref:Uncharacterized protein n=1 Tax=Nepenthes gracilis TaxID=150966 RepID=A0AAD3TH63_NEPGR|nr:hypothetical protein Nepgr_031328 [Nepenthes gracilis]